MKKITASIAFMRSILYIFVSTKMAHNKLIFIAQSDQLRNLVVFSQPADRAKKRTSLGKGWFGLKGLI